MTSQQLTTVLRVSVTVLLVAVIGLVGVFGYTVYQDRQEAVQSTPALRTLAAVKKEVRKQPNNVVYRVRLGEAYAAAGKNQEAIEQFNAALKLDGKHIGAWLDLGMVAMIAKHEEEAVGYFTEVTKLTNTGAMRYSDARREQALFNLGNIALNKNDYEKAIGYFKEALRIRKDASDTYLLLARAFVGLEDTDSALKYVEYALAFDPNFAQANYQAGELYLQEKDFLKASEHIRRAIDAAPEAPEPQLLLAKLGTAKSWSDKAKASKTSEPKKALEYIKIARRIVTDDSALIILHGQILEELGKNKEALTTYEEAKKLESANDQVKAALARLEKANSDTKSN